MGYLIFMSGGGGLWPLWTGVVHVINGVVALVVAVPLYFDLDDPFIHWFIHSCPCLLWEIIRFLRARVYRKRTVLNRLAKASKGQGVKIPYRTNSRWTKFSTDKIFRWTKFSTLTPQNSTVSSVEILSDKVWHFWGNVLFEGPLC